MDITYSPNEETALSFSLREEASAFQSSLPVVALEMFGPGASACAERNKAAMVRFGGAGNCKEFYLDAAQAKAFLGEVEKVKRSLSLKPVVFSVRTASGKAEEACIVDKKSLRALFRSAEFLRGALAGRDVRDAGEVDPSVRKGAPSRDEIGSLRKIYEWSAKPEPCDIGLDGIDENLFLALLYNNAKPGGDEIWSNRGGEMLPAEGRHLFSEMQRLGAPPNFNAINSRPIQTCFGWENGKRVLSVSNYWGQTGTPVVSLIPLARRGIYTEVLGKGFRGYKEEAINHCSLLFSLAQKLGRTVPAGQIVEELDRIMARCVTEKTLRDCLGEQEEAYHETMVGSRTDRPYQVSLFNFDPKEVGHAVKPFYPKPSMRLLKGAAAPHP